MGVVAAIVPWNFPLMMACWKLGPALATGNSVVLKPSEQDPMIQQRVFELIEQAGRTPFYAYDRGLLYRRVAELREYLPNVVTIACSRGWPIFYA